jgi:hypothetical protein
MPDLDLSKMERGQLEELYRRSLQFRAKADREIERLRRLITWCAPRLKKDEYAISLWEQLDNPREADHTAIIQS